MGGNRAAPILLATAAVFLCPTPLAHADDPGACVDAGNTVEFCDQNYLNAIGNTGARYEAGAAIALGHNYGAIFGRHPNKAQFSLLVNRLIEGSDRMGDPLTVDQAVRIVQMAVRFYGPPGAEDTLNSVMSAP